MSRNRNALIAGLFIILSFAMAVAAVVLIRDQGAGPMQQRIVQFSVSDDVGGLSVGDDVRIGGVKVGTVQTIEIVDLDTASPKVLVGFSISTRYVLHEDAKVGVQMSLTGSPDLNVASLGSGTKLADGKHLIGVPDSKAEIFAGLSETVPHIKAIASKFETQTLPRLNDTVDSARELVRHVNDKIDPIVKRYDTVAETAGQALSQVRDVVGDTKGDIRGAMKNLNVASGKLPTLLDKATTVVDKLDGMTAGIKATLEDIQQFAANTREITSTGRSLLVENHARIDAIIKGLKSTSDNLKATSIEIRHSPWRLLHTPGPDEMANLNLYDSARQFAEGAGNLSDASSALHDALKDPKADKAKLQKLLDQLNESFTKFKVTEEKLWSGVKE